MNRLRQRDRSRYEQGLPDYHDPLAGFGDAPQAQSALTLRLVLAVFGLIVCTAGALAAFAMDATGFGGVLAALAVVAAVDIVVIAVRKSRGEPG